MLKNKSFNFTSKAVHMVLGAAIAVFLIPTIVMTATTIGNNVSVGGTLTVVSTSTLAATTVSTTLGVTGAATFSSTLGVSGVTTLATTTISSGNLTVDSTTDGATGAGLVLYQNSASPAFMDALGVVTFRGKDDGGNVTDYVTLTGVLADPTGGAEKGVFAIGGQDQSGSASYWMAILREGTDVKLSAFNAGDSVTIDTDSSGDINLSPAGSGQLVVNKPIVLSSTETIAAGGTSTAMDLETTTSYVDSDAGGDVFTLADGTDGQQKTVIMASATGIATITPTNFTGGTSVTVATAGATATFQFSTAAGGWVLIGESGATII